MGTAIKLPVPDRVTCYLLLKSSISFVNALIICNSTSGHSGAQPGLTFG